MHFYEKFVRNISLCFLDSPHDCRFTIIGTFDDTWEDPGDPSIFWFLQTSHDSLFHDTDELFVAQLPIAIRVKQSKNLKS